MEGCQSQPTEFVIREEGLVYERYGPASGKRLGQREDT